VWRSREKRRPLPVTYRPPQPKVNSFPAGNRNPELLLLLAVAVFVSGGLWFVRQAKQKIIAAGQQGLAEGRILNLSQQQTPEKLRPALSALRNQPPADQALAERALARWLNDHPKPLPNVGRLSALRVTMADLKEYPRSEYYRGLLESIAQRREERIAQYTFWEKLKARWREFASPPKEPSVRVLSVRTLSQAKPLMVVRTPAEFQGEFWRAVAYFFLPFLAAHLWWRIRGFRGDQVLLPLIMLLTGIGFIYMLTLRDPLRDTMQWQDFSAGVLAGVVLLALVATFDIVAFARNFYAIPLGIAAVLFVLLLLFGSGPGGSGVRINLFGVQPIEFIKLLLAFFLAGYLVREWQKLRHLTDRNFGWLSLPRRRELLPVLVCLAGALAFLFLSGDLGPALILTLTFLAVYCLTRRTATPALVLLGSLACAVWIGYTLRFPEYVARRIDMWFDPWRVGLGRSMQLANSLWALSSGGATGAGFEFGMPERIEAAHTDLVFAGIGEELGFLGIALIFVVYALLFRRFLRIARSSDIFGFYLGITLALMLAVQLILIAGGTLGLVPLSGVVAPFLSYGRSSMLVNLFIVGVLLSISNRAAGGEAEREFGPQMQGAARILAGCAVVLLARAAFVQLYAADDRMAKPVELQQWAAQDPDERQELALRYGPEYLRIHNPRLIAMANLIPRGTVSDRNGLPIATSHPDQLEPHANAFASLGLPAAASAREINGRYYPFGVESYFILDDARKVAEEQLRGYGSLRELVPMWRQRADPKHPQVARIMNRPRDVRLTIDMRLQLAASRALGAAVKANKNGAAVLLDAATGETLALATRPLPAVLPGDPEIPSAEEATVGLNLARLGQFPPGSSFKLVTAMAALRANPQSYAQKHNCEPVGEGRVGKVFEHARRRYTIRDFPGDPPHGDIAMHEAIVVSCNAYFAQLAVQEAGAPVLRETAAIFGISLHNRN